MSADEEVAAVLASLEVPPATPEESTARDLADEILDRRADGHPEVARFADLHNLFDANEAYIEHAENYGLDVLDHDLAGTVTARADEIAAALIAAGDA